MNTALPVEVSPPGESSPRGNEPPPAARLHFSRRRLALAFTVAVLSDGLALFLAPAPPLQWVADGVTALLLFVVLGRQWILLPGLVMEAIPGLNVIPFWVLVVGAVAIWGTVRPNLKLLVPSGKAEAF